jgi:polyisoprenoid-binding protein YceI
MKKLFLLTFLVLSQIVLFAQAKWDVDNVHSSVRFSVSHLVISEMEGSFQKYTGTITGSKPDFTDAVIEFTIDVNSLSTENEMRDKHLKSPEFFDVEKYPSITFKSTSFKKKQGNKYELNGNITMHGVTKPAKFDVDYGGTANDGMGNTKAGFKASTTINRFDYGLKWDKLTETGGAMIGKEVTISLKLEFTKKK